MLAAMAAAGGPRPCQLGRHHGWTSTSGAIRGVYAVDRYTPRKSCMRGCRPPLLYTERQVTYRRPNGYVGVCLSLTKLLLSVPDYL